jgi:hypothetical protein
MKFSKKKLDKLRKIKNQSKKRFKSNKKKIKKSFRKKHYLNLNNKTLKKGGGPGMSIPANIKENKTSKKPENVVPEQIRKIQNEMVKLRKKNGKLKKVEKKPTEDEANYKKRLALYTKKKQSYKQQYKLYKKQVESLESSLKITKAKNTTMKKNKKNPTRQTRRKTIHNRESKVSQATTSPASKDEDRLRSELIKQENATIKKKVPGQKPTMSLEKKKNKSTMKTNPTSKTSPSSTKPPRSTAMAASAKKKPNKPVSSPLPPASIDMTASAKKKPNKPVSSPLPPASTDMTASAKKKPTITIRTPPTPMATPKSKPSTPKRKFKPPIYSVGDSVIYKNRDDERIDATITSINIYNGKVYYKIKLPNKKEKTVLNKNLIPKNKTTLITQLPLSPPLTPSIEENKGETKQETKEKVPTLKFQPMETDTKKNPADLSVVNKPKLPVDNKIKKQEGIRITGPPVHTPLSAKKKPVVTPKQKPIVKQKDKKQLKLKISEGKKKSQPTTIEMKSLSSPTRPSISSPSGSLPSLPISSSVVTTPSASSIPSSPSRAASSSQPPPPYSAQSPPPYSSLSQNTDPIDSQAQSLDVTRKKQSAIMDDIERRKKSSIHSSKTEEKDTPSSMSSRINRRRGRNIDPLQDNITSRPLTTPNSTTGTRRKNQKPVIPTASKTRKKKQKLRFADEDSGKDPLVRRKGHDPSDSPTSINTPSTPSSGKNDGFREVMIRIQDASFGSGLKPAITTVDRAGRTARGALREISIASEGKATVR